MKSAGSPSKGAPRASPTACPRRQPRKRSREMSCDIDLLIQSRIAQTRLAGTAIPPTSLLPRLPVVLRAASCPSALTPENLQPRPGLAQFGHSRVRDPRAAQGQGVQVLQPCKLLQPRVRYLGRAE